MTQATQQSTFSPQVDYTQYPSQQSGIVPPAPIPHQLSQQPAGQQNQYQTVVAIPNLGMAPAPVDCPTCGKRAMTNTTYHSGNVAQ
jgi:hypothetical protein